MCALYRMPRARLPPGAGAGAGGVGSAAQRRQRQAATSQARGLAIQMVAKQTREIETRLILGASRAASCPQPDLPPASDRRRVLGFGWTDHRLEPDPVPLRQRN